MSNIAYWDAMRTPPQGALKEIKFGNLRGKSDINPQWRMQVMTETFGPCGIGWKYETTKEKTHDGPDGVIALFISINLYIKVDDVWSEPIPGTGGSMLVIKDKNGLHINDEAYKMATTDALSVAMKQIGVAADIYMGIMDGSKYSQTSDILDHAQDEIDRIEQTSSPEFVQWCRNEVKKNPQRVISEIKKAGM